MASPAERYWPQVYALSPFAEGPYRRARIGTAVVHQAGLETPFPFGLYLRSPEENQVQHIAGMERCVGRMAEAALAVIIAQERYLAEEPFVYTQCTFLWVANIQHAWQERNRGSVYVNRAQVKMVGVACWHTQASLGIV